MVIRLNNARTNYGSTTGSFVPPPPYSWFSPLNGPQPTEQLSLDRSPLIQKATSWTKTRTFGALVAFIVTMSICMSTMPVTYCNDPADPRVRERAREEWSQELLEHEKRVAQREVVKAKWAWEEEQHAELLRGWEQERVDHEQELKERARREEEQRERLGLFWNRVEIHQCKTYGTREYTAVLMNLPVFMNWQRRVEVCMATPLEVHGVARLPKSCEYGSHGIMVGRWEIDQYEPDCTTWWGWYKDKESLALLHELSGCTSRGSGKRRIEHYLENLPKGGDWREFCATTPARFLGMEFAGAQECFQWNYGTYGQWEIEDHNC